MSCHPGNVTTHVGMCCVVMIVVLIGCDSRHKAAARMWTDNMVRLEKCARQKEVGEFASTDELVRWFEETTGIKSRIAGTFYGRLYTSNKEIRYDMEQWKAWYAKNKSRLIVADEGVIRTKPE